MIAVVSQCVDGRVDLGAYATSAPAGRGGRGRRARHDHRGGLREARGAALRGPRARRGPRAARRATSRASSPRSSSRSSRSSSPPANASRPVLVERPLGLRAVPVELEVVAVGVGDVDRLVRAVVGELAERPVDAPAGGGRVGQVGAGRVEERDVVQAGHAVGLRRAARRLPRVEAEVVVVAAGGDEQRVAGRAPARDVAVARRSRRSRARRRRSRGRGRCRRMRRMHVRRDRHRRRRRSTSAAVAFGSTRAVPRFSRTALLEGSAHGDARRLASAVLRLVRALVGHAIDRLRGARSASQRLGQLEGGTDPAARRGRCPA